MSLREFQVDDAVIRGVSPKAALTNFDISQLDCRGADLSAIAYSAVRIGTLLADDAVRVSTSFPTPDKIVLARGETILGADDIGDWLAKHGRNPGVAVTSGLASAALKEMPVYSLLNKAARIRQYWLRDDEDDPHAYRIVNDQNWPDLERILLKHGFLRVESRPAAGQASKFFHIKHRERILAEQADDGELKRVFDDLQGLKK